MLCGLASVSIILSATNIYAQEANVDRANPSILSINVMGPPYNAKCDSISDDTSQILSAQKFAEREKSVISIPAGRECYVASISADDIKVMFVGPGRLRTKDGHLRAPTTSILSSRPRGADHSSVISDFDGDRSRQPITIEHRTTGTALGQPSNGYQIEPETAAISVYSYNSAGYNAGTATNSGRTGTNAFSWQGYHTGQGDLTGYGFGCNATSQNPYATNFLAVPACIGMGGTVRALVPYVGLQGVGDINVVDGGNDVSGAGFQTNLTRTNTSYNASFLNGWWAYSAAANNSTYPVDAAFTMRGNFKVGLDLADAASFAQAAIVAGAGQRYYGNGTNSNSFKLPQTLVPGTEWFDYSATNGWEWYIGGNKLMSMAGTTSANFTEGYSQTNSGSNAVALGGYSSISSACSFCVALGGAHSMTGPSSSLRGLKANDRSRYGFDGWANGFFTTQGDAQTGQTLLRGTAASASAVRLTSDSLAPSANCDNIPDNTVYSLSIRLVVRDVTTPANSYTWRVSDAILLRGTGASTTTLTLGTPATLATNSFAPTISASADTSTGCLSLSVIPPSGNTDTLRAVAKVESVEVQ